MKTVFKYIFKGSLLFLGLLALLFVCLYFHTKGNYQIAATAAQNSEIPSISINGTLIHAESYGKDTNPVVIVIHGGPGNDFRYLLSLKALSNEYFVVFYDQRGSGLSERVSADELSLESTLEDLDAIIDYYGKGNKVHLIGHSWGGMLASGYAAWHPEKLGKVIVAEPGMLTSDMAKEFMAKTGGMKLDLSWDLVKLLVMSWFESLHIDGPDDQARQDYFWTKLIWNSDPKTHPLRGYYCSDDFSMYTEWRYGSVAAQAILESGLDEQGNMQIDLVSGLENYPDTVLFLTGSCNSIIGEDHQRKQMKYFQKAKLIKIQDAGHWMFLDKPYESIYAVRRFLNQ